MDLVPLLSVSISAATIIHNLDLPRMITQICAKTDSSPIRGLSSLRFLACEFKSRLYEIGTTLFVMYSSLRSICLPASVNFLRG
jgi:hypothetical protein